MLSKSCVNMLVPPRMCGIYALSNSKDAPTVVRRAEKNICEDIKNCFNEFKYFWFEIAPSLRAAFIMECEFFHDKIAPRSNGHQHPQAPPQSGWHCPICNR